MITPAQPSGEPARILIAEDSRTQAQRLRHILEQQGYEVGVAGNGRLALEMAASLKPALIISDVVMPEMDGYELCRRVKADAAFRDVPVILVTTLSDPQDVVRGLECGADNFVLKPYDEHYLLSRVRYVLINREMRRVEETGMGVEIYFNGQRHFITADRLQILNLLLSTYDAAIQRNTELSQTQRELRAINTALTQANRRLEQESRRREQAQQSLRESEQRLRSIVDNMATFVGEMTPDGVLVEVNRTALQAGGLERQDVIGKRFTETPWFSYSPAVQARLGEDIERALRGETVRHDVVVRMAGGALVPVDFMLVPVHDGEGRVVKLIPSGSDITERKYFEQSLQEKNVALEAAGRAKSTFLATMSHEIRTPMNGVLGMIELLSLTKLDAEQRTTLGIVRESGKSLLRIIDDILDFSKIEAGKLEIRPEAASIRAVIEGVHNIYAGTASSKGLLLRRSADPDISPALLVDPVRLRQILNNFVSNALKFTAEGTIEIKAELLARAGGEDKVRFSVSDTGIGISAENQRRLFQPFTQAEGDTTRRFGGTGLGLAICRQLASMMGGSIEMQSEPGRGTSMMLTLALPVADPGALRTSDPENARGLPGAATALRRTALRVDEAEAQGALVLLVDDHPTNRLLLERQVQALGYAAESAANGIEALEKWSSGRFAIVITDCNMPEMDGYELARRIRSTESGWRDSGRGSKRIPILACTANALGGEAEICFAAGMDDYLAKPVELRDLLSKLDQWLPLPQAAAARFENSGEDPGCCPVAAADDGGVPLDRSALAAFSGGDPAIERDILIAFRRANDADAALLEQMVAKADAAQVARASHRIKGAGRMVGAMALAAVCERLESASRNNDWQTIAAGMEAFRRELLRLDVYLGSFLEPAQGKVQQGSEQ